MGDRVNIEIRAQRSLGLAGAWRLCVKGISHRLFRSALTLAVVTLAVAFFMFLLSENALVAAAARVVRGELEAQRYPGRLLARLFSMPSSLGLAERLAAAEGQPGALKEIAAVSGLDQAFVETLAARAARESELLRFFARLSPGQRLILVQKSEGRDIFRRLAGAEEWRTFEQNLALMKDVQLPGEAAALRTFVGAFPAYMRDLKTLEDRWRTALAKVAEASRARTGDRDPETWLVEARPEALREWSAWTREQGFDVTPEQWEHARAQVRQDLLKRQVAAKLGEPETKAEWRRVFRDRKPLSTDQKLLRLDDPRVETLLGGAFPRATLASVSAAVARENRLNALEMKLSGRIADDDGAGGMLSSRQLFLLLISFLVCAVGVANAMLMSITERFREIATMKCLGATDHYILSQFMLEAAIQGCCGGILGMIIGFAAAISKSTATLGGVVFAQWPGLGLCGAGAVAAGAGILLSVLASVYPAWAASRMVPMDAMRIE